MKPRAFLSGARIAVVAAAVLFCALPVVPQSSEKRPRVCIVPQTSETLIHSIHESLDGSRLLTHDLSVSPRLWDCKSRKLLRVLGGHTDRVERAFFSPDGKLVLTRSSGELRLWDAVRARLLDSVETKSPDPNNPIRFTTASFSPDSKTIAAGTSNGIVMVMGVDEMVKAKQFRGHDGSVDWASFASGGSRFVTASSDGTAKVWNATGEAVATLKPGQKSVRWAFLSPDGSRALLTVPREMELGSMVCDAVEYDVASKKAVWQAEHAIGYRSVQTYLMAAVYAGPKESEVVVATLGGTMSVRQSGTGKELRKLEGHRDAIREIRTSKDGSKVATYSDDLTLRVWDVATGNQMPFKEHDGPTAGEFSQDGTVFWVGYRDGTIREHVLATGEIRAETLGALTPMTSANLMGARGQMWSSNGATYRVRDLRTPTAGSGEYYSPWTAEFASDGSRMLAFTTKGASLFDPRDGKGFFTYHDCTAGAFSPDSSKFLLLMDNGTAHVYDSRDGSHLAGWKFNESGALEELAWFPDSTKVVTAGHENRTVQVWDPISGSILFSSAPLKGDDIVRVAAAPDGKHVAALVGVQELICWNLESGETVLDLKFDREKLDLFNGWVAFVRSGQLATHFLQNGGTALTHLYDLKSGKPIAAVRNDKGLGDRFADTVSPDGKHMLSVHDSYVLETPTGEDKATREFDLRGTVERAWYTEDGKRIFTLDSVDGLTIWETDTGKRLGNFVEMADGTWLVMDNDGRYDATDPSEVPGAVFVLEWEGGLEPIPVEQLKAQFYEPGLFGKLMGWDADPVRDVPNLESLRLFPEVNLTRSKTKPLQVAIELKDRDMGGLGKVTIFLNGKQVVEREGTGYFTFNAENYSQFLLPESYLPEGVGNQVAVVATNEKGDLASAPATLDIGVPEGLKAPEVRLFALFVGAGDYAGTGGDLEAPPADAETLMKAVSETADRLLPGRVKATLMVTDLKRPELRPSREKLLAWFDSVKAEAKSTDIVLAFFAGHGVSRIGEQRGYFFLTPDANPTEVNAATAGTSTLSAEDLKAKLAEIAANKQVIVLDTCHSGAAASLVGERSLSGDYQRAYESIKDATGTWMLAGSAADQVSYESKNVEHGLLTYALLEAIDKASPEGLRAAPSGELFIDVEKWLGWAAGRVESLKNEVGISGIQRPEFKRSKSSASFDLGVLKPDQKGSLGLKAPRPVVLIGDFEQDQEDPAGLEEPVQKAVAASQSVKVWLGVAKHPNAYRIAGSYALEGKTIKLKVFLQVFDTALARKTLETFELTGTADGVPDLADRLKKEIEARIVKQEEARKSAISSDP